MSFLEEIREEPPHIFSTIEFKILDYLSKCPWGATVYEIAREVKCSFKSLYSILRILERNDWITVVKEKNGGIGRPRNKYVLKQTLRSILKELEDCGCEIKDGRIKFLNLRKIIYPYSLTIFKRTIIKLKYGECLLILLENDANYLEFIDIAYRKDLRLLDISFKDDGIRIIFRKI